MAHWERSGGISVSPTSTSFQGTRTILDGQRIAKSLCPGRSQTQSSLGTTVDNVQNVAVSRCARSGGYPVPRELIVDTLAELERSSAQRGSQKNLAQP